MAIGSVFVTRCSLLSTYGRQASILNAPHFEKVGKDKCLLLTALKIHSQHLTRFGYRTSTAMWKEDNSRTTVNKHGV